MPSLRVERCIADSALRQVEHGKFRSALAAHWTCEPDGHVRAQSVCWLFCWAKTGLNSESTAHLTRCIFDEILNVRFADFDSRVPHEWARKARYDSGNIEARLSEFLT